MYYMAKEMWAKVLCALVRAYCEPGSRCTITLQQPHRVYAGWQVRNGQIETWRTRLPTLEHPSLRIDQLGLPRHESAPSDPCFIRGRIGGNEDCFTPYVFNHCQCVSSPEIRCVDK